MNRKPFIIISILNTGIVIGLLVWVFFLQQKPSPTVTQKLNLNKPAEASVDRDTLLTQLSNEESYKNATQILGRLSKLDAFDETALSALQKSAVTWSDDQSIEWPLQVFNLWKQQVASIDMFASTAESYILDRETPIEVRDTVLRYITEGYALYASREGAVLPTSSIEKFITILETALNESDSSLRGTALLAYSYLLTKGTAGIVDRSRLLARLDVAIASPEISEDTTLAILAVIQQHRLRDYREYVIDCLTAGRSNSIIRQAILSLSQVGESGDIALIQENARNIPDHQKAVRMAEAVLLEGKDEG
ncbi:MAG: hypothetical protein ACPGN3_17385 [Opitutales bacterium]